MKGRQNVRTDEIDNEAAIGVSSSGCVEKRLSVWQGNRAEGGWEATSVGVGVAKIEDRREITVYGGSGSGRGGAYKNQEANWEKKINEDVVMAHIFYCIQSHSHKPQVRLEVKIANGTDETAQNPSWSGTGPCSTHTLDPP